MIMNRILLFLTFTLVAVVMTAQPAKSRKQQQETKKTENPSAVKQKNQKGALYRTFPVAQDMPEDVDWKREVYRELNLSLDENAPLYYPITPQGNRSSLFTYLFKLILRGQIKAYKYGLDGVENFSEANKVDPKELMRNFEILFEENDKGQVRVNDADLPSESVKCYYVKESTYFDQHTASFHSKVTAICPILIRGNADYGDGWNRNPMFWVNYEEAAPYLGKLVLMTSNLNNAATMSAADYFAQNLYKGDIYRTVNMQDKLLVNDGESEEAVKAEREKVEKQISDFETHLWRGDTIAVDTTKQQVLDEEKPAKKSSSRRTTTTRRSSSTKSSATKPSKQKTTKAKSSSGSGYSVRRQRH